MLTRQNSHSTNAWTVIEVTTPGIPTLFINNCYTIGIFTYDASVLITQRLSNLIHAEDNICHPKYLTLFSFYCYFLVILYPFELLHIILCSVLYHNWIYETYFCPKQRMWICFFFTFCKFYSTVSKYLNI